LSVPEFYVSRHAGKRLYTFGKADGGYILASLGITDERTRGNASAGQLVLLIDGAV